MADSFEDRKRKRELEDERDHQAKTAAETKLNKATGGGMPGGRGGAASYTGSVAELMDKVEPLIERLNSLYNQFIAGVESRPPIEVRSQLDQVMTKLRTGAKPTPAQQFRYSTLLQSYSSHSERWDKLCRDLESGKIKRAAGPKKSF